MSDFYNANKKKLVAGKGWERVLFNDGERLHLWVSRDFKGELLLKSAGQLLMRIDPAKFDTQRYDNDPKTKPVPIVVALGKPLQNTSSVSLQTAAAPVDEDCAILCVVDGDLKGIPTDIWEKLKSGGGGKTGLAELDPNNIATRNWLLGQIAGAGAYVADNWNWLRASVEGKTNAGFKLLKAKIHYANGKARYYFSGYSKSNAFFRGGGFGPGHERVITIFSGAGQAGSSMSAAAKSAAGNLRNCGLLALVFGSLTSLTEWKNDVAKDGYDLAGALLVNLLKTLIISALTSALIALLVYMAMFALGMSMCVLAVGVGSVLIGVGISYGVAWLDKEMGRLVGGEENTDGMSTVFAKKMRENVEKNWTFLRDKKFWDYKDQLYEKSQFN